MSALTISSISACTPILAIKRRHHCQLLADRLLPHKYTYRHLYWGKLLWARSIELEKWELTFSLWLSTLRPYWLRLIDPKSSHQFLFSHIASTLLVLRRTYIFVLLNRLAANRFELTVLNRTYHFSSFWPLPLSLWLLIAAKKQLKTVSLVGSS